MSDSAARSAVPAEQPGTGRPQASGTRTAHGGRSESIGSLQRWILGARPRTLGAAVVPVAVGTALGWWLTGHHLIWWHAIGALVVALGIQVGANYANDVGDGVRGTDTGRSGPVRLVAAGLASPAVVRLAALGAFGVAAVAGLALAAATSWWLLAVGAACFAAGWLYTGGPMPYGYVGLGEVFVLGFFGVVATVGTTYVLAGRLTLVAFVASLVVGLLAAALLMANNLRDRRGDAAVSKRTLAVRLGRANAGRLYVATVVGAAAAVVGLSFWRPWALIGLVAVPLAVGPVRLALGQKEGADLLPMLGATARLQVVVGLLVTVGLVL